HAGPGGVGGLLQERRHGLARRRRRHADVLRRHVSDADLDDVHEGRSGRKADSELRAGTGPDADRDADAHGHGAAGRTHGRPDGLADLARLPWVPLPGGHDDSGADDHLGPDADVPADGGTDDAGYDAARADADSDASPDLSARRRTRRP